MVEGAHATVWDAVPTDAETAAVSTEGIAREAADDDNDTDRFSDVRQYVT